MLSKAIIISCTLFGLVLFAMSGQSDELKLSLACIDTSTSEYEYNTCVGKPYFGDFH